MAHYTFAEAVEMLGVDPKTARRWLEGIPWESREHDERVHLYTREQLAAIATAHGRILTDEAIPAPTIEALAARVVELERKVAELQAARETRYTPRYITEGIRTPPATSRPPVSLPAASREHPRALSASQEDLARRALPVGWIARSTWSKNHGLNERSVKRSPHMPIAEEAPEGEPWGGPKSLASHLRQAIYAAYRKDQLEACARGGRSFSGWHPCDDLACPCKTQTPR